MGHLVIIIFQMTVIHLPNWNSISVQNDKHKAKVLTVPTNLFVYNHIQQTDISSALMHTPYIVQA